MSRSIYWSTFQIWVQGSSLMLPTLLRAYYVLGGVNSRLKEQWPDPCWNQHTVLTDRLPASCVGRCWLS